MKPADRKIIAHATECASCRMSAFPTDVHPLDDYVELTAVRDGEALCEECENERACDDYSAAWEEWDSNRPG